MKKLLVVVIAIVLASCATTKIGLEKHTGFTELPFPSNSFKSGQIVEVYSNPRKVEITHPSEIPWDQATVSEGWSISSTATNNIRSTLATEISKVLKAKYQYASTETIQVDFTNTKTTIVPKSIIYSAVKKAIKENSDLQELIKDYMDTGTHFDVITTTLSANVSFTLVDASKNEVSIDSEIIKKLNSDFNIDFSKTDGSKKVVTGSNLVIGIHLDPKLVSIIMKKI